MNYLIVALAVFAINAETEQVSQHDVLQFNTLEACRSILSDKTGSYAVGRKLNEMTDNFRNDPASFPMPLKYATCVPRTGSEKEVEAAKKQMNDFMEHLLEKQNAPAAEQKIKFTLNPVT